MLEKIDHINRETLTLRDLPAREGPRPKTLRGPLHIQVSGHGDRKYVDQLITDVLSWPHIETLSHRHNPTGAIPVRFEKAAATIDSAPFISAREFARVLLGTPTIYLALPLVGAHWAIVQGWAEPHYLGSVGLMPAGTVVVYTPKNRGELSICYSLFSAAYHSAFPRKNDHAAIASLEMSSRSSVSV
jgi:hypothetical protein